MISKLSLRTAALPLLAALLVAALLAGWYRHVFRDVDTFTRTIDVGSGLFIDFLHHYYPMGRQILRAKLPVFGFYYSPFFALLLWPWGQLAPDTAAYWWGVGMQCAPALLLFGLSFVAFARRLDYALPAYVLVFFGSMPLLHNFRWGQVSLVIVLLGFAACYCFERQWRVAAALFIVLAVAMKFYVGLLFVYPLLRGDWRTLGYGALFSLLMLLAIPAFMMGPHAALAFYAAIHDALTALGAGAWNNFNSQFFPPLVFRLARAAGVRFSNPEKAADILRYIGYAFAALNFVALRRLIRGANPDAAWYAFALIFGTTPFLVATSWPHYFVYLPVVQLFVFAKLSAPYGLRALLLAASVFVSNVACFSLTQGYVSYSRYGFLFFANLAICIICYVDALHPYAPPISGLCGSSDLAQK